METLGAEIAWLKAEIIRLKNQITDMAGKLEKNINKPYTKTGINRLLGNKDMVFDGTHDIWKTYAVYKDEPEDEPEEE